MPSRQPSWPCTNSTPRARPSRVAVARRAGISRQWLYTQPQLRAEIEQLRERNPLAGAVGVPNSERARERSLRQRNETLLADNRRLCAENDQLRAELAVLYGQLREPQQR